MVKSMHMKQLKEITTLEKLFEEWHKDENLPIDIFCEDGIIDTNLYGCNNSPKILFVLKDAHLDDICQTKLKQNNENVVNMREDVLLEGEGKTWNPLALWSTALIKSEQVGFNNINVDINLRRETLPEIAFMNLKKEGGGPQVSDKCVKEYVCQHKDYIIREIELCDPDVIIACSKVVFESLSDIVFDMSDDEQKVVFNEKMQSYGHYFDISNFLNKDKPVYVVEYRHPACSGASGTYEEHYNNMLKIRKYLLEE